MAGQEMKVVSISNSLVYSGRNSAKPRSRPSPTRTAVRPSQIPQCDMWTAPETAPEITRAEKAPHDRTPTKRTPRIKTPQPTVERPARACGICGADITQRHPNTRKCRKCRHFRHYRLPLTELRRSRARERKCLDCEADISIRVHNALRCQECAPEHKLKQGREYRSRPEIQQRDSRYRAHPENRARQNKYQKEYYEEKKKNDVRNIKAQTARLNAQVTPQAQPQGPRANQRQEEASPTDEGRRVLCTGRAGAPAIQETAMAGPTTR